jgi:hypothetical protein
MAWRLLEEDGGMGCVCVGAEDLKAMEQTEGRTCLRA